MVEGSSAFKGYTEVRLQAGEVERCGDSGIAWDDDPGPVKPPVLLIGIRHLRQKAG